MLRFMDTGYDQTAAGTVRGGANMMTSHTDINPRNIAGWDRALRIGLGLLLLGLGWAEVVSGLWGVTLKLFGWVPLITGVVGWCPFYALLAANTRHRDATNRQRRRPPHA